MSTRIRVELSVMMFIQFFIWGAWFVTMGTYLTAIGFPGPDVGKAYSTTAWGAIVAPFFIGMIADRFFSAEKVMGILHLVGGVILFYASTITDPRLFFWVVLAYALCYMPTLGLVNAIAFNQMDNPEKQFPSIRVWGTLGWIIAGLGLMGISIVATKLQEGGTELTGVLALATEIEATAIPLKIAAAASLLMGVYSFFLPNTPPQSAGKTVTVSDVLCLDALKLMKDRSFAVFVLSSLFICIPLAFYYAWAATFLIELDMKGVVGKMTLGQMSEVVFMVVMPFFFAKLGVKKMLIIGMLAWVVRYFLFAFGDAETLVFMLYAGILLHGICYDFFFVTGQIYVDNEAPEDVRASAQGFIALVTYGVGMVIGSNVAGYVAGHYEIIENGEMVGHAWRQIWIIPAVMAGVVMCLFILLFKDKPKADTA